jgi:hypothetical protein
MANTPERISGADDDQPLEWWSELDRSASPESYDTPATGSPKAARSPKKSKARTPESSKPAESDEPTPTRDKQEAARSTQQAVIDRFEGNLAILLVGEDEKVVNVPRSALPKRVREGQWLKVRLTDDGDRLESAERDPKATAAARKRIADKLARIKSGEHLQ